MIPDTLPLVYFGKLPCRGDFVRSRSHMSDINVIDQWVSQALSESADEMDTSLVLHFSHVDTAENKIMTGVLISSYDSSNRQYPFIGFGLMHLNKPKTWMQYLPIKSAGMWHDIHQTLDQARSKVDNTQITETLNQSFVSIDHNASTHYYDFINSTTLQEGAMMIDIDKASLIEQIIATGLLFLPTFTKGFHSLNKAIYWSLPDNKTQAIYFASFWHDLIHGFYAPHQLYFNSYFYWRDGHYHLLMSFSKPAATTLMQILTSTSTKHESWVNIADSSWTQQFIDDDIGLSRFHNILLQDDAYLYDVRQLFKTIFLAK
ncbi:type VI secretion system-associated protein TagF [Psychrobacter celer]|uniref:type VI secretion system-associated protein TagF n=1 Tax=Psychrobacter celer TaxID=306572 RepID=UPI003FCF4CFE